MRTKISVGGKWYKPVPWHEASSCDGCEFDGRNCINASGDRFNSLCDSGNEFAGMIFIHNTKESLAAYIAQKLEDT
jgi:hypothetical protein